MINIYCTLYYNHILHNITVESTIYYILNTIYSILSLYGCWLHKLGAYVPYMSWTCLPAETASRQDAHIILHSVTSSYIVSHHHTCLPAETASRQDAPGTHSHKSRAPYKFSKVKSSVQILKSQALRTNSQKSWAPYKFSKVQSSIMDSSEGKKKLHNGFIR